MRFSGLVQRTASAALLIVALAGVGPPTTGDVGEGAGRSSSSLIRFGMDAASAQEQRDAGVPPDYGTLWVGVWNLKSGWQGTTSTLERLIGDGIVPAIQFYYWGDDLSAGCLKNGCDSKIHQTFKSREGWQQLASQLAQELEEHAAGAPVLIMIETEFNRADVARDNMLDAYLAEKARYFKEAYPAAEIVLPLGAWNFNAWETWHEAARESDYIGIQAIRGATRHNDAAYLGVANWTADAITKAHDLFGKPIILHDIALSSFPEPDYVLAQAEALASIFNRLPEFKQWGVEAILYRSWMDSTTADTRNYFGRAEQHWGLAWPRGALNKPAADVWIAGVLAERTDLPQLLPPRTPINIGGNGGMIEPERFVVKTSGTTKHDPTANHEVAWHMQSSGYLLQPFSLAPGLYEVALRVRATANPGEAPDVHMVWDKETLLRASPGVRYQEYPALVVTTGHGVLEIRFGEGDVGVPSAHSLYLDTVRFTRADRLPVVAFDLVQRGPLVAVDATSTWDPDGDPLHFEWTFGDGATATGPRAVHRYLERGEYEVTLVVYAGAASIARGSFVSEVQWEEPRAQAASPGVVLAWASAVLASLVLLPLLMVEAVARARRARHA